MTEIADPNVWAEFGLPGLIILALFALVIHLLNGHKAERKEWREDSAVRSDKVVTALDSLKDAIHKR